MKVKNWDLPGYFGLVDIVMIVKSKQEVILVELKLEPCQYRIIKRIKDKGIETRQILVGEFEIRSP